MRLLEEIQIELIKHLQRSGRKIDLVYVSPTEHDDIARELGIKLGEEDDVRRCDEGAWGWSDWSLRILMPIVLILPDEACPAGGFRIPSSQLDASEPLL